MTIDGSSPIKFGNVSNDKITSADSTKPSKSFLPKSLEVKLDAAHKDLKLSFGSIGDLLASPFHAFLSKPDNAFEVAENVFWGLVLPATVPSVLLGAALMLPMALVSGMVSFATASSDDFDSRHYEDPNPLEHEISLQDNLEYNPLTNPEDIEKR